MPWFKVDDTFALHAKTMAVGNEAVGLWTRAGSWSMQQLTDGFIPNHVVPVMGTVEQADALVRVGLWEAVEGGYMFHEWLDRQPSREQVEADRRAAADRQRKAREAAKSRRESQGKSQRESRCDIAVSHGGSHSVSHGPPDPTRPDPITTTSNDVVVAAAKPRKRATRRPADWRPTPAHEAQAHALGIDLATELARFADHHDAKGTTFVDWDAAFRNWLRRAADYAPRPNLRALPGAQPDDLFARARQRMGITEGPEPA